MPMTNFRIRVLDTGLPQYKIAADIGIPPSRISEYALGKRPIPVRHLFRMMDYFQCNVEDIVGYYDEVS